MWMSAMPSPCRVDDGIERVELRYPPQHAPRLLRASDQLRWITGPPRADLDRQARARHPLHRLDYLPDRESIAVAQVEGGAGSALAQIAETEHVGLGQVDDVNVVADARPVGRGVIGAEDLEALALSGGRLQRQRDQVGLRFVPLTDRARGIGTGRIEVPEGDRAQAVSALGILEHALDHQLAGAVGV